MKIYFDGGCRPNPGPIETAVVAGGRTFLRTDLGRGDSNDAEWLAAIEGLQLARSLGVRDVTLLGDSTMVVDQINGATRRVAPRFAEYLATFQTSVRDFDRVRIRYVRRGQNLAGIALERAHGRL
ncbi:ribonuclease HI [Novosphingobium sp. PhB165]|uniref:reverse transcriptase-like protein n=1 Tax=Novosphingobium sp. PhB165 TaxID=2485105 RepID=UPI0010DF18CA|nr:reverse transcriptase-like protein [Novosphingobium sp. PhB165]TCM20446.1 ribonuclease HI [Novosphingobium sp. PhB165]